MKTFLSILALFFVLNSKGQTALVNVVSVTDTVTTGDTIHISFTYTCTQSMARMQVWTTSYLQECLYEACPGLAAYPSGPNNTHIYKVKITTAMGFGNARIYANGTPGGYKPFYIKQNDVGMKEYDPKATLTSVKYYDIYGKEKAPNSEGLTIRLLSYSNGYQKAEKIMLLEN